MKRRILARKYASIADEVNDVETFFFTKKKENQWNSPWNDNDAWIIDRSWNFISPFVNHILLKNELINFCRITNNNWNI